jgi:hypothetical protein
MSAIASATEETVGKKERVFSRKRIFEIPIPSPEGTRIFAVRFPTDEEWCWRARALTAITRNLGRDARRTDVPDELRIAKELVAKILHGESREEDIEEYTARKILETLGQCELAPTQDRIGNVYVIEMIVPGATVTHRLKIPTQRQIGEFEKSNVTATARRNSTEIKLPLEPTGELWEKIQDGVSGYDDISSVSILHKDVSVKQVIAQVNDEILKGVNPEG